MSSLSFFVLHFEYGITMRDTVFYNTVSRINYSSREWNLDNNMDEDCDFVQIKSMLLSNRSFLLWMS